MNANDARDYVAWAYIEGTADVSFGEQAYDNAKDFFKFSQGEKKVCPDLKGYYGACRSAYDSGNIEYDFYKTKAEYLEALAIARDKDEEFEAPLYL